jgi:hypothetical protein
MEVQHTHDEPHCPFEGPEKLLEIWFKPSAEDVPDAADAGRGLKTGLRKIDRQVWEQMLDIVKCQVLSVIEGAEMDAYLLRSVLIIPYFYVVPQDSLFLKRIIFFCRSPPLDFKDMWNNSQSAGIASDP